MLEVLARSEALTVIVGAGVSAEAHLPSWWALVRSLLDRAGRESLGLDDDEIRAAWLGRTIAGETPLGAAAVVEALASDKLGDWIPEALYGDDAGHFQPGPIARKLPALRDAYGTSLRILTTNYDDLVEQTIDETEDDVEAVAFSGPAGPPVPMTGSRHQRVVHLHGFLARDGRREGEVILSEADYHRLAQQDWQQSEVGNALMNTPCVFIGSSLTDPNLLRYLHLHAGPGSPRHYAIFTRQDQYAKDTPPEVIAASEAAVQARWAASNVEIVFVDYYAEIALALAEIARAKHDGETYTPITTRLADWRTRVGDELLVPAGPESFPDAQDHLHLALSLALESALKTVADLSFDTRNDVLAATLWIVDEAGETLTSWAMTDRVHRDPNTIEPVKVDEHSRWVAVRAFCRGSALGEPRDIYASRWRYIRGLPLSIDGMPVGTLTVSSMLPQNETILDAMPDAIEAAFDDALRQAAVDILDLAFL
jgi:hypothetical protein